MNVEEYLKKDIQRIEADLVRLTGFHQALTSELQLKKKQLEELNNGLDTPGPRSD